MAHNRSQLQSLFSRLLNAIAPNPNVGRRAGGREGGRMGGGMGRVWSLAVERVLPREWEGFVAAVARGVMRPLRSEVRGCGCFVEVGALG